MMVKQSETQTKNAIINRVELLQDAGYLDARETAEFVLKFAEPETVHNIQDWTHKLLMNKPHITREMYMSLLLIKKVRFGSLADVSNAVRSFLLYVCGIPDLAEICVVNDLGFADVWLVFPELTEEKEKEITQYCMSFCRKTELESVHYLILSNEQFSCYEGEPLVRLSFEA